jgi:hypothetical protein
MDALVLISTTWTLLFKVFSHATHNRSTHAHPHDHFRTTRPCFHTLTPTHWDNPMLISTPCTLLFRVFPHATHNRSTHAHPHDHFRTTRPCFHTLTGKVQWIIWTLLSRCHTQSHHTRSFSHNTSMFSHIFPHSLGQSNES